MPLKMMQKNVVKAIDYLSAEDLVSMAVPMAQRALQRLSPAQIEHIAPAIIEAAVERLDDEAVHRLSEVATSKVHTRLVDPTYTPAAGDDGKPMIDDTADED